MTLVNEYFIFRTFNESPVNPRKCTHILSKILFLINQVRGFLNCARFCKSFFLDLNLDPSEYSFLILKTWSNRINIWKLSERWTGAYWVSLANIGIIGWILGVWFGIHEVEVNWTALFDIKKAEYSGWILNIFRSQFKNKLFADPWNYVIPPMKGLIQIVSSG
jgi:hypothetical protein